MRGSPFRLQYISGVNEKPACVAWRVPPVLEAYSAFWRQEEGRTRSYGPWVLDRCLFDDTTARAASRAGPFFTGVARLDQAGLARAWA